MTKDETLWTPVSNGSSEEFNDFPLAFVNVDKETDEITYNVDGKDVEPEETDDPMIVGEFEGIRDISAEDNSEPSVKVLIESEEDERTYALNKVKALESQLEEVEEGSKIGIDFDGYQFPDDGMPWQNWTVFTPE